MRDQLFFFLNGQRVQVGGREAWAMLAPYLRGRGLSGTKIACAHGACGSCSVLLGREGEGENGFDYQPINACIFPLFACDGAHILSVEGLNGPSHVGGADDGALSPVQQAMVECHGAQCGFCTPGMVISLTALHQRPSVVADVEEVKSALEGNLCRCTGYSPIIDAALSVETADFPWLDELYPPAPLRAELNSSALESVEISVAADALEGDQHLFAPRTWNEAAGWKAARPGAIVVAGATEIGVAMSVKGLAPREILSLAGVEGGDEVRTEDGALVLGARASWTQVAAQIEDLVPEFGALLRRWGSPQLRNAGTVAGNIMRAASNGDSLPFLLVCQAQLEFLGASESYRVAIADFLENPGAHAAALLRRVWVPLPSPNQRLRLFKVARRRAFDRSIVSAAFLIETRGSRIETIRIALGGAAPGALRLPKTEAFLRGQALETAIWREAGTVAQGEISPISDAAASRNYRAQLVANLLRKFGGEM